MTFLINRLRLAAGTSRTIILAICATLVLTVVVCCYAVTVVVAAIFKGLDAVFQGLFQPLAFALPIVLVLMAFPWLVELVSLLSTGQVIPFVARLLYLPLK